MLGCRVLIAVVFAVSAFSKLRSRPSYRAFALWLAGLPVLSARGRKGAAPAVAAAEVGIVLLLALPWTVRAGLLAATAALAVFTAGTLVILRRGVREPCQCFGAATVPMGARHVVRNALLCVVAAVGASGPATAAMRGSGVALSLAMAAVAAMIVLFLDELTALFGDAGVGIKNG
jgi:hypothetical protein